MWRRVLTVLLLLVSFTLTAVNTGYAINSPEEVDQQPIDHPWGGDDNSDPNGQRAGLAVAPFPKGSNHDDTRAGVRFSLWDFAWQRIEIYISRWNSTTTVRSPQSRTISSPVNNTNSSNGKAGN